MSTIISLLLVCFVCTTYGGSTSTSDTTSTSNTTSTSDTTSTSSEQICTGGYCVELVGNSGAFRLLEQGTDNSITVDMDGIEEMDGNGSTASSNSVNSISGFPWAQVENPNCDGSGASGQSSCVHVRADPVLDVGGVDVSMVMDVMVYNSDVDVNGVSVSAGNLKFNIRVDDWPSFPDNTIDFLFDIASRPNQDESDGFVDYLGEFEQCCCDICTTMDVGLSYRNWRKQTVSFPTCDDEECPTTIIYDPVLGLGERQDNGSLFLTLGLVAVGAVLAGGLCCYCRKVNRKKNDDYTTMNA